MAGGVALQSLRVTSDFDASGYARGAAQKVAADQAMISSDKARNAALAQADAALARVVPGMASVSKALLDGYGAGAQFEAIVRRIGNSVDQGMGIDRANVLLDQAYKKFNLTADAAVLAQKGYVSIAGAVGELNERYGQLALAAASANAAVKASSTQSGINQSFGIGTAPAKSAQESADAFLAQYGGLEGIAKAKAAEIGAAFGADLDSSIIAGVTKSARDSASVFEAQFKQLDTIAQQRAEQAGSNFQNSLNASLGIGGPSAASQGATYSALAEEIQRLDQIEQSRASHLATSTQQSIAAAFGYDQISKSARDSAAAFMEIDAAGASLAAEFDASIAAQNEMVTAGERLRAQIDPMGAEFARLGTQMASYKTLLNEGVISTNEYEQAQVLLAKRLTDVQMQLKNTSNVGRVASGELVNLSYQVNDIVTGFALGQSPFMILAQQGGQVFQIFQTSKASILDFVSTISSKFLAFLTVGRLVFGGIAGAIGLAVAALISFSNKQQDVQRSLLGAGKTGGSTVSSINAIANAGSSPSGLSVSESRQLASALAETGKVANDNILPIVKMGKDIATVFGVDATEAAKMLAQAFADPVKGADDLNARLGFLDAATKQNIADLVAQNNNYAAQVVLSKAVKGSLEDVALSVSTSRTAWTAFGNAVSNAWDEIGKGIYNVLNPVQGLEGKLEVAKQNLEFLQKTGGRAVNPDTGLLGAVPDPAALDAAVARVDKLTAALQRQKNAAGEARAAQQSLAQQQAIRTALPQIAQTDALQNQLKTLQDLAASPDVDQKLTKVGQSMDQLQRSIAAVSSQIAAIPKTALVDFLGSAATPAEKLAAELEQIRIKAAQVGASETDLGRAIAGAKLDNSLGIISARNSALGVSANVLDIVKQRELELAKAQIAGADLTDQQITNQKDLTQSQALGTAQIKAQIDSINIQAQTINMSAGAAAEFTARMTLLAEAARNHKVLTDADIASINSQAKALGDAAAKAAQIEAVQTAIPQIAQNRSLQNQANDLQALAAAPDVSERLAKVGMTMDQLGRAIAAVSAQIAAIPKTALVDFLGSAATPAEKLAAQLEQIRIKAAQIGATPQQTSRAVSGAQLQSDISVQSARTSALGASASTLDLVKDKELALQQAQINGAGLTKGQIKDQIDLARATANGTLSIKAQVDSVTIQTATIGMSVGAAAEYTARMNLIAEALRNKKKLTDDDIAAINAQAKALGQVTQANALAQIRNDIRFGAKTALLSPEDVQIAQQLKGIYPDVATALGSVEAQAMRVNQAISGVSGIISNDLVTGIADATDGTKTWGQSFADTGKLIIRALEEMILKLYIIGPLMRGLQSSFGSFLPGSFTPGQTGDPGLIGPVRSAYGNAFASGNVIPFARGGIVTRPTYFPMANGAGLMGEAGPEAVMPLRRGTDGRLGVSMSGGGVSGGYGMQAPQVNVILNEHPGGDGSVKQSKNANGGLDIEVSVAQIAAKSTVQPGGAVNSALSAGYGLRPKVAAR